MGSEHIMYKPDTVYLGLNKSTSPPKHIAYGKHKGKFDYVVIVKNGASSEVIARNFLLIYMFM